MAKRTRLRRKVKRRAPAVRHPHGGTALLQTRDQSSGLLIGGAHDPAEKAADHAAAQVMSGGHIGPVNSSTVSGAHIHRACAACKAKNKDKDVRRSAQAPMVAPGAKAQAASSTAARAITSMGAGRPMNRVERGFFEPRFGRDFSDVRIHEGPSADKATKGIDAQAFTYGRDVAFAQGANTPFTMAHELAHVAQEDGKIRRKIKVVDAHEPAPGFTKKSGTTSADHFKHIISEFPGSPVVDVAKDGIVSLVSDICDKKDPSQAKSGLSEIETNTCLCYLIAAKNTWNIELFAKEKAKEGYFDKAARVLTFNDAPMAYPVTRPGRKRDFFDDWTNASGGTVMTPTTKAEMEFGFVDKNGKFQPASEWTLFAHELCGHVQMIERGTHKNDKHTEMRHHHEDVIATTNKMRLEKDPKALERPETVAAPHCAESVYRKKGTKKWKFSGQHKRCQDFRDKYMKKYHPADKKKYKLSDPLPPPAKSP